MMKKIYLLGITCSALLLSNCSNEEFIEKAPAGNVIVSAIMEDGNNARSNVDEKGLFTWSKSDNIAVYTTNENSRWAKFTLQGEGGTATGSFAGSYVGDGTKSSTCAVYPYNEGQHSLSGSALTFHMPASYDYKDGNTNAPMLALIAQEGSTDFAFKHLGGVVRFTVNNVPANTTQFVFTTSHQITGDFTVTDINDSEAKISTPAGDVSTNNKVTIKMEALTAASNKIFYIPMPAGTYTSMKIEFLDVNDKMLNESSTTKSNTIERRTLLLMPTITCSDVEGSIIANASDVSGLNDLLSSAESADKLSSVTLSGEGVKDISTPITIPNTYTGTSGAETTPNELNLTFDAVPSSTGAIEIKDANTGASTAEQSKAKVEVFIPAIAADETAPSFDITLPTATVTLSATGESTTYNEVTASTAENTLIVGKGVTVNKLIVKGGNVRVKNGGTVSEIVRAEDNKDIVKIYVENGATIPSSLDANTFTVLSAEIADLEAVAKNGGTYTLNSDIVLTTPLVVEGTMALDLNGHSIKPNNEGLTQVLNTKDAVVLVRRGADLTINDSHGKGSIDGSGVASVGVAVKMTDTHDDGGAVAKLTVNGGTIKGYYYGICGNGDRNGTEIIINGGTITTSNASETTAIYHPQGGLMTVTGGVISGETGIEMRSGTLTVSGGTIKGTATVFKNVASTNGTTINGAAVAVSQHTTNQELKAIIKGGILEGIYALYEEDLQGGRVDNISLEIADGIFAGGVYSENCTSFIKGGTFSDPNNILDYLATNANVNVKLEKDCSIPAFNLAGKEQQVTVDLQSHTLTLSNNLKSTITATASFKNGNIKMSDVNHRIMGIGGKLKFDKVHISGANYALWVQGPDATLDITNGSKIEANYFPISTAADLEFDGSLTYGDNATINLQGSEFIGKETGFMNNVPARVTIDNCKFSGNHQAALLRGGDYTIKNSTFTLNAELESSNSENLHFAKWGAGNRAAFAGITVGNYLSTAYQYYTKVVMENVTVNVEGTYASSFPAMHVCANKAIDKGVTITYDTQSSFTSSYNPNVEYGTTNITVNDKSVIEKNEQFIIE